MYISFRDQTSVLVHFGAGDVDLHLRDCAASDNVLCCDGQLDIGGCGEYLVPHPEIGAGRKPGVDFPGIRDIYSALLLG